MLHNALSALCRSTVRSFSSSTSLPLNAAPSWSRKPCSGAFAARRSWFSLLGGSAFWAAGFFRGGLFRASAFVFFLAEAAVVFSPPVFLAGAAFVVFSPFFLAFSLGSSRGRLLWNPPSWRRNGDSPAYPRRRGSWSTSGLMQKGFFAPRPAFLNIVCPQTGSRPLPAHPRS